MKIEHQSRYFDALSFYPHVKLDLQHENEKIVLLIREHPITQVPWIVNTVGLILILILLNMIIPQLFSAVQIVFIVIFSASLIFAYGWLNFLRWYFQVGIVTNQRILDIDFKSVLYKEVSIAMLSNVEEIESRSGGYIGTLFNYGDIFIQTAGADINIEFPNTPDPTHVVKLINQLTQKFHGGNN